MSPVSVEIRDKGLERIAKEAQTFRRSYVKVGFPEGGKASGKDTKSFDEVVQIAAVHEFGAPKANIPERSFLRAAYDRDQAKIRELFDSEYLAILDGRTTARRALTKIGAWFQARVRAYIVALKSPPLAPATEARKARLGRGGGGVPTPLVDTGQMVDSVQFAVVING